MRVRLTAKGRVTIPKKLRDDLHIRAGTMVEFGLSGDDIVIRKAIKNPAPPRIDPLQLLRRSDELGLTPAEYLETNRKRRRRSE